MFKNLLKTVPPYRGKKTKGGLGFNKTLLTKAAINHLIENYYFDVRNLKMKEVIGIPIGID